MVGITVRTGLNFNGSQFESGVAYRAGLAGFERQNNIWGQSLCLFGLALASRTAGRPGVAYRYAQRSLEIYTQISSQERALSVRNNLGKLALELGYSVQAREYYETNRAYYASIGDVSGEEYYTILRNQLPGKKT